MDKIQTKKNIHIEMIVSIVTMLICISLFLFFPSSGIVQKIISGIVFFVIIPMLYVKIILKKSVKDFFRIDLPKVNRSKAITIFLIFIVVLLVFIAINKYTGFNNSYFLKNSTLIRSAWGFIAYELLIVNFFIIIYEIFFRGFIMSYFLDKIGKYAIFVQFLFFLSFLFLTNGLSISYIYYIIIALPAGIIAYRNQSIIYSYIFSLLMIIIGDIIFLII